MTQASDTRQFKRLGIASVVLPFIGLRTSDFQPFQYMLMDVSQGGVGISIPRWLASRERLHMDDEINLHVPFSMDGTTLTVGSVVRERWHGDDDEQRIGLQLTGGGPDKYGVFLEIGSREIAIDLGGMRTLENILLRVIKDSVLLKRGVLIYLRHLSSYFSRLGEFSPEEYHAFRETILGDIGQRVQENMGYLESLQQACLDRPKAGFETLDLEELRRAMEPELYLDLFRTALGDDTAALYLHAIKDLEGRLFSNYNTMVMLYIGTL
ncbi:MAG: PilZ domain-containing protein [Pseudomonadota bacterium]